MTLTETKIQPVEIETDLIDLSTNKVSKRFENEPPESEDMQTLIAQVKEHGIMSPILVRPKGANRYEVVAGNRRLRAARALRLKTVPVIIKDITDAEVSIKALVENIGRKDLNAIQKAKGIAAAYTDAGIPPSLAIAKLNHLYTSQYKYKDKQKRSVKPHTLEAESTEQFLRVFRSIGLGPDTQYKFLTLITELPQTVQKEIEDSKIGLHKAELLTHSKLKDHP